MTEVAFAKTFLAALDARPVKLSADHVEDPKNYQARSPVCCPSPIS
jgi:ubiquitin-like protein 4